MQLLDDNCDPITPKQFLALVEAEALAFADKKLRRAENALRAAQLLAAQGVNVTLGTYSTDYIGITGTRERFRAIHRALGPLKRCNMNGIDSERVQITLRPKNEDFDMVFVSYYTKLPKSGKCKIVSRNITAHEVVCEV